ncbi:hypothetical protein [Sporosarcina ureilytica]|uniref:Short-chain dehydrogenase n=1 Tax=Sporosarcina ureilytica TaxID=298596 RepID=A0A1D8JIA2_9BACL|nr:hypothetical protein [Sporosarcina ureilytica]AOV08413.1 hypothetical protein BI350_13285 [Sporosarcina ureilytica]
MDIAIWIMPFIIVTALMIWITVAAIRKSSKLSSLAVGRDEIPEVVEEHPFTLNPVIWVILIASLFIAIVITYYAAATSFT